MFAEDELDSNNQLDAKVNTDHTNQYLSKIKTKLLNANSEFKKENHFAFKYIGQSRELLISFVISDFL